MYSKLQMLIAKNGLRKAAISCIHKTAIGRSSSVAVLSCDAMIDCILPSGIAKYIKRQKFSGLNIGFSLKDPATSVSKPFLSVEFQCQKQI